MFGCETAMLPVAHFETAEIALESIGVVDKVGIVQEVEHMRHCMHYEAAGAFEIAEDFAFFGREIDLPPVAILPIVELSDPTVAVCGSVDVGELKEQIPQVPGVGALGSATAPGQALPLNVHQTPLQSDLGPLGVQIAQQLRIPIGGDADRIQPVTRQLSAKRFHALRTLLDTVRSSDQTIGLRVHHSGDRSPATAEIGAVDEEIPIGGQIRWRWRRLIQPVVNNAPQCPRTVPALLAQLPYAVSFAYPSFKPDPLTPATVDECPANTGATTTLAPPPLLSLCAESIPLPDCCTTTRTCLFDPLSNPLEKGQHN